MMWRIRFGFRVALFTAILVAAYMDIYRGR